jgi:uncharacterized protein YndB with AHSA1/START domain
MNAPAPAIAPIVQTIEVKVPPARAFAAFTGRMGDWWQGGTIGKAPQVAIEMEPRPGGRWFERDAGGVETDWGRVLAWEPPSRLLLAWQIDAQWRYDPDLRTELELRFEPVAGGTRVTLEHRGLERLGSDAARIAGLLATGWPGQLAGFAALAEGEA